MNMIPMMNTDSLYNNISDGVAIFELDNHTLMSHLKYINKAALNILECSLEDRSCVEHLYQFLGVSKSQADKLIVNLIEHKTLVEEYEINTCANHVVFVNSRLTMFKEEEKSYIQVIINKVSVMESIDDNIHVKNYLESLDYSKGYLGIVIIKNRKEIMSFLGIEAYKEIEEIIFVELEKSLGSVGFVSKLEAYYFIHFNSEDKTGIENKIKLFLENIKVKLLEDFKNSVCYIKIGLSSYVDNKYNALHEAKYCLQMILNTPEAYLFFAQPYENNYMNFLVKSDLPYAIEKGELDVYFQGIYTIDTVKLYGFEALIRWKHHKYGEVSPSLFIPFAEQSDLITTLDLWVIKKSLMIYKEHIYSIDNTLKLNINVSPKDFYEETFVDTMLNLIHESGVPYSNIIVELTETLNLYPKRSSLARLKKEGILIALDDFGTGFASLSQIKNYEIDILKIDISFISDINKNYNNTLITGAILSIAKDLKISVVAEGVETTEQVNFLLNRDCDFMQGFKFHKPQKVDMFQKELMENVSKITSVKNEIIDKRRYVDEYLYGKYIYLQIDNNGVIILNNNRLSEVSDVLIEDNLPLEELIADEVRHIFRNKLKNVIQTKTHCKIVTYTKKARKLVPIVITMEYNKFFIDVYIENYMSKNKSFDRLNSIYSRYDMLLDSVKSGIIITDLDFKIDEWNKGAEAIFGYTKSGAVGENIITLLVQKKDYDKIGAVINNTLIEAESYSLNENITKNNQIITCEWENTKLYDENGKVTGLASIIRDVTLENEINEELNLLSTVVMQDPSPIVITDLLGNIEYVNEAFSELTQYSLNELIGKNPHILSTKEQPESYYQHLWETISKGDLWQGQLRNKKKDGSIYVAESRIFPIINNHEVISKYACIQNDITDQIDQAAYVKEMNSTLESQERLSMIGQMAAGIMHEINNPLSYMDMNIHALQDMVEDIQDTDNIEEIVELAVDLKDGIESIKKIADGLKRFIYKSESLELGYISLNEEIRTIIAISKNEYKYYATLEFEPGDIEDIYGDAGKIKQVILNLVINAVHAIKATEQETFGLISIKTYQHDGYVYCDISDNGCGIPESIQDRIFEVFFTTKGSGKGTGLGLSLSKKIIEEEHHGQIYFETKLGEGTTFTLKFEVFNKEGADE